MGCLRWIEECLCCIPCKSDPRRNPPPPPVSSTHQNAKPRPTPPSQTQKPGYEHKPPAHEPRRVSPRNSQPDPYLETASSQQRHSRAGHYRQPSDGVPYPLDTRSSASGGNNGVGYGAERVSSQPAPDGVMVGRKPSRPKPSVNLEDTYVAQSMTPVNFNQVREVSQMLTNLQENIVQHEDKEMIHDHGLIKVKSLGQGGFGTVWLCEREVDADSVQAGQAPKQFALKELIVNKVFRPGVDNLLDHIKQHIPVNEAAIQQYMQHENVVKTYWSDVRVVDPDTKEPLDLQIKDLSNEAHLTKDKVDDLDKTFVEAWKKPRSNRGRLPPAVHLQLRIAMEYCKLGCLKDYLRDPTKGQRPDSLSVLVSARLHKFVPHDFCALMTALDIANALKLMHKNRILHGDLKPHNVLLSKSRDPNDKRGFIAKLADFGLAAIMKRGDEKVPIKNGTIAYLPKDAFTHMAATTKTDVYALGLILWELWHGIFWFSIYDAEKRRRRATIDGMHGYVPRCATDCPAPFAEVVHACLSDDPKKRPEVKDICKKLTSLIPSVSPDFV